LRQWFASFGKILSAEQTKQALQLLQKQEGTVEFDRRWILHAGQNRLSLRQKEKPAEGTLLSVESESTRLPDGRTLRLIPTVATAQNRFTLIPKILPLTLRTRKNGDKILTRAGTRSLAKQMMEQKIPAEERDRRRILTHEDEILWCEGLSLSLKTAPKTGDEAYFVFLSAE
jgi:tRNA(Ile)-lysidine synthetase-like protein